MYLYTTFYQNRFSSELIHYKDKKFIDLILLRVIQYILIPRFIKIGPIAKLFITNKQTFSHNFSKTLTLMKELRLTSANPAAVSLHGSCDLKIQQEEV